MLLNATPLNRIRLNGTGGYYDGLAASVNASATVAPAGLSKTDTLAASVTARATTSSSLGVEKRSAASVAASASTSAQLGVRKNQSASVVGRATTSAAASKSVNMSASVTMAGLTIATVKVNKLVSAAANAQASVSANAHIDKLIRAAALAAASVSVSALLGKRLQGALNAYATTQALAALSVNMGADASTDSGASGELLKFANFEADLLVQFETEPMVFVERTIRSPLNAISATASGLLVFTHLVSSDSFGSTTFEQSYSSIFAEAELIDTWMNHIKFDVSSTAYPITATAELYYPATVATA